MTRLLLTFALVSFVSVTAFPNRGSANIPPNELPVFALHVKYTPRASRLCTTESPEGRDCETYNTSWNTLTPSYVYIVVGRGSTGGIAGASFGIAYNPQMQATDYIEFTQCADGQVFFSDGGNGDFPAACGGIRVSWDTCQQTNIAFSCGAQAVVGAIYMYAYGNDVMSITPNNNLPSGSELALVTCQADTIQILDELASNPGYLPSLLGKVQFGVGSGFYTPCSADRCLGYPASGGNASTGSPRGTGMDPSLYPCLPTPVLPTSWGRLKSRY